MTIQVTETVNEGLKRGYSIVIPASVLDQRINAKLKKLQPEHQLRGFRKGKVPLTLLKRTYGEQVFGEAIQEVIEDRVKKHFGDSDDRPALQPKIEISRRREWKDGDDIEAEMSYEVLPEFPDVDLKSINLERMIANVTEADLDNELNMLAKRWPKFEDRPEGAKAENGDRVMIDFVGSVDGEEFEDGLGEDFPLVLGSGSFFEGFEEQLVGAGVDDRVSVKVTIPDNYFEEHLRGKEAAFDCTVKAVQAKLPSVIDDEFARKHEADDLESLKMDLRDRMKDRNSGLARMVMKRRLFDALDERLSFELPPSMVEQEAKQIAYRMWRDDHPDAGDRHLEEIEPDEEHNRLAERRVRLGLFLAELGLKAGIEISDMEMGRAMAATARRYPGEEHKFIEMAKKNPAIIQQVRAPIFEDKVVDYIVELATVSEQEVSLDELRKAVEAEDEEQ